MSKAVVRDKTAISFSGDASHATQPGGLLRSSLLQLHSDHQRPLHVSKLSRVTGWLAVLARDPPPLRH